MKRFTVIFAVLTLMGAGCSSIPLSSQGYRLVTIEGDVEMHYDQASMSNDGMVMCLAKGTYEMKLWFPRVGGDAVAEKSTLRITDLTCPSFGSAQACVTTLLSEPEDLSFTSNGTLRVESARWYDEQGEFTNSADEVTFWTELVERPPTIKYKMDCPYGEPFVMDDYGSAYNQILSPFTDPWNMTVRMGEGQSDPSTYKDKQVFANMLADITVTITETLVSEIEK